MPATESAGITGVFCSRRPGESVAERRRIVEELARQLDLHDDEHVGAWGTPDVEHSRLVLAI